MNISKMRRGLLIIQGIIFVQDADVASTFIAGLHNRILR